MLKFIIWHIIKGHMVLNWRVIWNVIDEFNCEIIDLACLVFYILFNYGLKGDLDNNQEDFHWFGQRYMWIDIEFLTENAYPGTHIEDNLNYRTKAILHTQVWYTHVCYKLEMRFGGIFRCDFFLELMNPDRYL